MSSPRPLVVVVDDDLSVRRSLERLLRSAGYAVETFDSALAFLDRGDLNRADCLVLDVRMPGQSGIDLHKILIAVGIEIPTLFITGHGDLEMAVQARKAGAVEFLAKPFDDAEFLAAVREASTRPRPGRDAGSG